MTVTYTDEVANSQLCGFTKLLLRWKGSVYKLLWRELFVYCTLYTILSVTYRYVGNTEFRNYFEKLCLEFQRYTDSVPIIFLLGIYVTIVLGRWWRQYLNIPWPDSLAVIIAANVRGRNSFEGQRIRRNLLRYLCLSQVLTFQHVSGAVRKKYKDMSDIIKAGFMTEEEGEQLKRFEFGEDKYLTPLVWFANLLSKVRKNGGVHDGVIYQTILKEMNDFRGHCSMLVSWHQISIPLVVTQVVTGVVYGFLGSTLLSGQYLDVTKGYPGHTVDLYVPFFTVCQFFGYFGLLKIAEQLMNPFGEDDDDFDVNALIERNWKFSLHVVEDCCLPTSIRRIEPFVDSNSDSSSDKILSECPSHSRHHTTDTGRVIKETFLDQETCPLVLEKQSQIRNGRFNEGDSNVGDISSGDGIDFKLDQRRCELPSIGKNENDDHRSSTIEKQSPYESDSRAQQQNKSVRRFLRSPGNYVLLRTTDSDNETKQNPMLEKERKSTKNETNAAKERREKKSPQTHEHPVPCSDVDKAPMTNEADYHQTGTCSHPGTCQVEYLKTNFQGVEEYKMTSKVNRKNRRNEKKSSDSWPECKRRPNAAKTKRSTLPIQATSYDIESSSRDLRRDTDHSRTRDSAYWERDFVKIWISSGTAENSLKSGSEPNFFAVNYEVAANSDMIEKKMVEDDKQNLSCTQTGTL